MCTHCVEAALRNLIVGALLIHRSCDEDSPITCDENQHHQHHGWSVGGVWGVGQYEPRKHILHARTTWGLGHQHDTQAQTKKPFFTLTYLLASGVWGHQHNTQAQRNKQPIHSPASWGVGPSALHSSINKQSKSYTLLHPGGWWVGPSAHAQMPTDASKPKSRRALTGQVGWLVGLLAS